jgi:hypothetical protein
MGVRDLTAFLPLAASAMLWSTSSGAASPVPDLGTNSVLVRQRPGLEATGFAIGGLRAFPALDAGLAYDDNIYNSDTLVTRSVIYFFKPRLALRSDWNVHSVSLDASAEFNRYTNVRTENSDQYRLHGTGRLDVTRNLQLTSDGRYVRATEPRGTAGDQVIGGDPVVYQTYGGTLGASLGFGRFRLSGDGGAEKTRYDDVRLGAARIPQGFRNRTSYGANGQLGYSIGPGLELYVRGQFDRQRYATRNRPLSLDSRGATLLAGVEFSITQLISGHVGIGHMRRNYQEPLYRTTSGFTYDGSVLWNPTTLLTLTIVARKAIGESPEIGASGIVADSATVKADYELLRNLIIDIRSGYAVERYRGLSRTDRRLSAGLGGRYLMNRFAEAGLRYDHVRQRGSGLDDRDYRANTVQFSVTLQR